MTAEEILRAEFNRWAEQGRAAGMERHHRRITEKALDRMRIVPHDRCLDVGCGSGWATRWMAQLAPQGQAVGIDVSDEMIRLARRLSADLDNVLFAIGSAEEIPWKEEFFSALLSVESAYYWPDPERAAREIFRVMAPAGRVFILINFYRENHWSHRWQEVLQVPVQLKSAAEWAAIFKGAGFALVATDQVPDDTPVEAEFHGSKWWSSRDEEAEFRRIGALLIEARKPG